MNKSEVERLAAVLSNTSNHLRRTENHLRMRGMRTEADELQAMVAKCLELSDRLWIEAKAMPRGKVGRPSVSTVKANYE